MCELFINCDETKIDPSVGYDAAFSTGRSYLKFEFPTCKICLFARSVFSYFLGRILEERNHL